LWVLVLGDGGGYDMDQHPTEFSFFRVFVIIFVNFV